MQPVLGPRRASSFNLRSASSWASSATGCASRAARSNSSARSNARRAVGSSAYSAAMRYSAGWSSERAMLKPTWQPAAACKPTTRRASTRAQEAAASAATKSRWSAAPKAAGRAPHRRLSASAPKPAGSRTTTASRTGWSDQRFGPERARIDSMFIGNVLRRQGRRFSRGSDPLFRDGAGHSENPPRSRGRRIPDPR